MQSVQRRFGKLLPRSADESQVAVLLKDFENVDAMLTKIIDASQVWRDSWRDILGTQQRLIHGFQSMYSPIAGADDSYSGHEPLITPTSTMQRTTKLQGIYVDLRNDFLEEIDMVEGRIIKPATQAKDAIQPLKKIIKKRGDRKLDFEKYQARVDTSTKKTKRSDRDNASLAKAEMELERAKEDYNIADDHLKSSLPPVIVAAFSLLPHLLAAHVMMQNNLLGQLYTVLHDFCENEGFPSPPPPMVQVLASWTADFKPVQHEIETSLACVAGGKARHQPLKSENRTGTSLSLPPPRNGYLQQRSSSQSHVLQTGSSPSLSAISDPPSPKIVERPRLSSVPSQTLLISAGPNHNSSPARSPSLNDPKTNHALAGPRADYFDRDRLLSTSSLAVVAAGKKKPPPPPMKRKPSTQEFWVKALYGFTGEGEGDLSFREGDHIQVLKKTNSTDDWWEGRLGGAQGSFPANYCQAL